MKQKKLTKFSTKGYRERLLSKTDPLDDFEYSERCSGLDGLTPKQNLSEQYLAQRSSSKHLLDSSMEVYSYGDKVIWLKMAGFSRGIYDGHLERLVKWDEKPSDDAVSLAFVKELEQQRNLFREAKFYLFKLYG